MPYHFGRKNPDFERARDCLASAAWYEAGDDSAGQRSVMQVVLNRLMHPAFPKTVCRVVFQGEDRTTGCQFTFTCDGALARRSPSEKAWKRAQAIAELALSGTVDSSVGLATHYHTDWVVPNWSGSLDKIARVGSHLFSVFAAFGANGPLCVGLRRQRSHWKQSSPPCLRPMSRQRMALLSCQSPMMRTSSHLSLDCRNLAQTIQGQSLCSNLQMAR
ncbi:MAG: cell wall hydrolase [Sphingomonadales bacterium]|nr:cell wall hydrolase [Sphingomonadales bacterium]